jgi:hypothetical protein
MPNSLSILGILHTVISILAVLMGFVSLFNRGKINPTTDTGRLYGIFTVVACISSLPLMKTGHPGQAHLLAVIILILLPLGVYARTLRPFRKNADYIQMVLMSTTLYLSLIPAVVETLTRLPPDEPLAAGPNSFIVQMILLALTILYLTGIAYQVLRLRSRKNRYRVPQKVL